MAHLPARFKGHDIQRLSSELEKANTAEEKREFESTEQWKVRLRLAEAQPLVGGITRSGTYAFVLQRHTTFKDWNDEQAKAFGVAEEIKQAFEALTGPVDEAAAASKISRRLAADQIHGYTKDELEQIGRAKSAFNTWALIERDLIATSDPVTAEEKKQRADAMKASAGQTDSPASAVSVFYDADRARFDITIQADMPRYAGESTLRVLSGRASSRAYSGSNGFGAVQEVKEYSFKEYDLLIANSNALPFVESLAPRRIHVELPMPPEKAQQLKPQIEVIAICKLAAPFTASGKTDKDPTRDDPISVRIDHKYLRVNVLDVWVYNHDTGVVYAKVRPTGEMW